MLAHELRNPLASISNAAALWKATEDAPNRDWAMDVVGRQAAQLARLVDDLLDVSRITSGKIRLRKAIIDAAAVLRSAADATAGRRERRTARIGVVTSVSGRRVRGRVRGGA